MSIYCQLGTEQHILTKYLEFNYFHSEQTIENVGWTLELCYTPYHPSTPLICVAEYWEKFVSYKGGAEIYGVACVTYVAVGCVLGFWVSFYIIEITIALCNMQSLLISIYWSSCDVSLQIHSFPATDQPYQEGRTLTELHFKDYNMQKCLCVYLSVKCFRNNLNTKKVLILITPYWTQGLLWQNLGLL